MTVLFLRNASEGIRGYLRRWMIEPVGGVFVGRPTATVRERAWHRVVRSERAEAATMIYTAANEQGFIVRSFGEPKKKIVDFDGALFVQATLEMTETA
jgi:CRISPR-associated protein Cas2